jgi:hypothetical protein
MNDYDEFSKLRDLLAFVCEETSLELTEAGIALVPAKERSTDMSTFGWLKKQVVQPTGTPNTVTVCDQDGKVTTFGWLKKQVVQPT